MKQTSPPSQEQHRWPDKWGTKTGSGALVRMTGWGNQPAVKYAENRLYNMDITWLWMYDLTILTPESYLMMVYVISLSGHKLLVGITCCCLFLSLFGRTCSLFAPFLLSGELNRYKSSAAGAGIKDQALIMVVHTTAVKSLQPKLRFCPFLFCVIIMQTRAGLLEPWNSAQGHIST